MTGEIDSGTINSLLVRPFSFYEYYMSQFLGYKVITTVTSLAVPLVASAFFHFDILWDRIPAALFLIVFYLFFVQTLSFVVCTLAFRLNRIHSITVAKNLGLLMFSGELVPLDLYPAWIKSLLLWLPFANAVYIPVGYLTGRIGPDVFLRGCLTAAYGIAGLGLLAWFAWTSGLKKYAGTGA